MKKATQLSFLILVLALFSTHYTSARFSVNEPHHTRVLKKVKWGPEPIEVTDLRLDGQRITLDQPFIASKENWVSDLSFKVINRSNKTIAFMRFELQFPLKGGHRPAFYVESIEFGNKAASRGLPKTLGPSETVELNCQTDVESLKHWLHERGQTEYANLGLALLSTEAVYFTDKTSWAGGDWLRFDSHNNKWVAMNLPGPEGTDNGFAIFQPAVYRLVQLESCYRSTHDTINCKTDCQCGASHDVTIPGADPGTNKESDKILTCCIQNNVGCAVAYTGVTPCT